MQQDITSLYELYLSRSDLRPLSVEFKRRALELFVAEFGNIPIGNVTSAIAEDFRTVLAKGRSRVTVNGYLSNFKPFFRWCQRRGRISEDPFLNVKSYKVSERNLHKFESHELARLVKVSETPLRLARVGLGLVGCRRGEMFNIRKEDIHLDDPNPHVLLTAKEDRGDGWEWIAKTHRLRYIALPEGMECGGEMLRFHDAIRECLKVAQPYPFIEPKYYRRMMRLKAANELSPHDIADPTGNFQRSFISLQRAAGIKPPKRYHDLRRTFGTAAVALHGLAKATIALGNATAEVTRRHYDVQSPIAVVAEISRMVQKCFNT
jgi:integrase